MKSLRQSSRVSFEPTEEANTQSTLHRDGSGTSVENEDREDYEAWLEEHPSLLHCFSQLEEAASGKLVTVFLDYDGTLTPIVNNPDFAFMSDHMRDVVRSVATLFPTAIISGRGRDKVEKFVQLKELYYAGSHGMDIVGPRLNDTSSTSSDGNRPLHDTNLNNNNTNGNNTTNHHLLAFQPAAQYEPLMQKVGDELSKAINNIPGATVEDNKFCVSVHFRNCDVSAYSDVVQAVETVAGQYSELKITRGRKVLEVRPQLEWDKGSALLHLLTMLGLSTSDVYCLYIGDDRTDEDAFKVLKESNIGAGILVSSRRKETMGRWTLRDPSEVAAFLHQLVAWGRTEANCWHRNGGCNGWALTGNTKNSSDSPKPPLPPRAQ